MTPAQVAVATYRVTQDASLAMWASIRAHRMNHSDPRLRDLHRLLSIDELMDQARAEVNEMSMFRQLETWHVDL